MTAENGRATSSRPAIGGAAWRPVLRAEGRLGKRRLDVLIAAPTSRWASWAERLAARHAGMPGHWRWVDTVLTRQRVVPRSTFLSWHLPVWMTILTAPGIVRSTARRPAPVPVALALSRAGSGSVPVAAGLGTLHVQRTVGRTVTASARPASVAGTRQGRVHATEMIAPHSRSFVRERDEVERLIARRERRERPQTTSPVLGAGRPNDVLPAAETLPTPPAVVVRSRPPSRLEPLPTPPRGGIAPVPANFAAPRPAAAVDVEALADQVIRTMDQRVVAARERMGLA